MHHKERFTAMFDERRIVSTNYGETYLDERVGEGPFLDAVDELRERIWDICNSEQVKRAYFLTSKFQRNFPKSLFEEDVVCRRADGSRDYVPKNMIGCLGCPGAYRNCSDMAKKGECLMYNVFHQCFDVSKMVADERSCG